MGVAPPHSPPESFTRNSNKSTDITSDELVGVGGRGVTAAQSQAMLDNFDDALADRKSGRSSSEEKEILTPAQNRRKAQNRAAYVLSLIYQFSHFFERLNVFELIC
jgi:hypothetical protein